MSWMVDAIKRVYDLDQRLKGMEEQFAEFSYSTLQAVQSQLKKNWGTDTQSQAYYGMRIATCVDTKDPFAQGRIRYYLPGLHKRETPLKSLPWAWPISSLGGFDDSGALWVPPAGSAVALLFEIGDSESAYYIGTVWNRDRGAPPHNWDYGIPEFNCHHAGHRNGYFVGPNDGSQVLPPGNTSNYNIKDFDDLKAFEEDTEALRDITPAHLHEIKTPQKHRVVMDDGNYSCNHRWKRMEFGSSGGHTFLMWDDHLRAAGQHVHPDAERCGPTASGNSGGSGLACGTNPCSGSQEDRTEQPNDCTADGQKFLNTLFKHESEVRAFRGPCTPQNNKCELQQTGVFLSSISGHIFVQDDEVEQPQGVPNWERSTAPFDFGCTDKFLGKMFWKSTTGHMIKLGDAEDRPNIRSGDFKHPITKEYEPNGILLQTATGHSIEMNDHTVPGGTAGEFRRIKIESTSKHVLEMVDAKNEQASEDRKGGGIPKNEATEAYVALRTGYGLQLLMRDDNSQQDTQRQFLELLAPHKDNCHGPHIFRMQEEADNEPGLVFLRCGGYFYGSSIGDWFEIVGDPEGELPAACSRKASKFTKVTENDIHDTDEAYVCLSDIEYHHAEQFIILAAGRDCENEAEQGPCLYPVVVGKKPWTCPFTGQAHFGPESLSDRVYASANDE